MKKAFQIVGLSTVFIGLVLLILSFAVDVNPFRARLAARIGQFVDGQVEVGKFSVSLLGRIRVKAAGLRIRDRDGNPVFSVQEADFEVPLLALLKGAPEINLKLEGPEIVSMRNAAGRHSLLEVFHLAESEGTFTLPGILASARFGIDVKNAKFIYRDELSHQETIFSNLNFRSQDLSLLRPIKVEIWGGLDTKGASGWSLKGPVKASLGLQTSLKGRELEKIDVDLSVDLDQAALGLPQVYEKKAGVAAHLDVAVVGTPAEIVIRRFDLGLVNTVLSGSGTLRKGSSNTEAGILEFRAKTPDFELKPWGEVLVGARGLVSEGTVHFELKVQGPMDQIKPELHLAVETSAYGGKLKADFVMDNLTQGFSSPYRVVAKVSEAQASQVSSVLFGSALLEVEGETGGFSKDEVLGRFRGKGNFAFEGAKFEDVSLPLKQVTAVFSIQEGYLVSRDLKAIQKTKKVSKVYSGAIELGLSALKLKGSLETKKALRFFAEIGCELAKPCLQVRK
ncbi:hypothetical protein WDW86_02045 [Bdellovibrionota bacterium FG-2]